MTDDQLDMEFLIYKTINLVCKPMIIFCKSNEFLVFQGQDYSI